MPNDTVAPMATIASIAKKLRFEDSLVICRSLLRCPRGFQN
jgi:hypothetical protein